MTDLFAARSQMAVSLGFHIIFASIGIAMPFLMAAAHYGWLKTGDPVYLRLTKAWSKGVAIFFATGAVSGTVLSFELGLLWPTFMRHAGAIIGMPFSWEGTAFFLEAIALGIFLYGWERVHPWVHWGCGVMIGVMGVFSGLFVVCANAWMNSPAGFRWVDGAAVDIDPWAAMFNAGAWGQGLHMTFAAFSATGFAVAGVHAFGLWRDPEAPLHRIAMKIALVFACVAALLHPLQGDRLAKQVARLQPVKLAAMESLFHTAKPAPLLVGGIPDQATGEVRYGLHIPNMLSFLAHGDLQAEVQGLDAVTPDLWPPVLPTHVAFQVMVALGTMLAGVATLGLWGLVRRARWLTDRRFLALLIACTPCGFIAMEAGWVVTEVGRQPWIIHGVMKTAEAVTPMPHLFVPFLMFTAVYAVLAGLVTWLMVRQFKHAH